MATKQRHHQRDRPLGEDSQRHRRPGEDGPADVPAPLASGPRRVDAQVEGGQREGDEEGEQAVEDHRPGEGHGERGGQRGEPRRPAGAGAEEADGEPGDEDRGGQGGEQRRQAHRQLRSPKPADRRRRRGEEQHRLVEVGETVELRHHPVAGRRHLPRHLGVAPLVRVHQRHPPEVVADPGHREHGPQGEGRGGRPGAGAGKGGGGHRRGLEL